MRNLCRHLGNDPYFLYSYAYALSEAGSTEQSIEMAERSFSGMANYDTALFLADGESLQGQYYEAERLYRLAASMCPVRFAPLYGLFCLYEEQGRFVDMKSMGQTILNKRIKVPSAEISQIRLSVRQKMMINNL